MANFTNPGIIPWQPCNIPDNLQRELKRRSKNKSFNYVNINQGEWSSETGDWEKSKGTMVPWVRFCSNGAGAYNSSSMTYDKPGFILSGGKNFYNTYGFATSENGTPNQSIIGYMPDSNNTPHLIDNNINTSNYPIHVPSPQIESVQVVIQKELVRRATINWTCFSTAQLEYMTAYFLVPGITCTLEWGWNHFNPSSLLDLTDISALKKLNDNPYPLYTNNIYKSNGNYDILFGKITHFDYDIEDGKIKCVTEITSQDRIYAGLVLDSNAVQQTSDDTGNTDTISAIKPIDNLIQFSNKILPQFKSIITDPDITTTSVNVMDTDLSAKLKQFIKYVKKNHPNNWQSYVYGIFYGRDLEVSNSLNNGANKKDDFDYTSKNKDLWINMGLLIEIINFHCSQLKSFKNNEMFRIDIDDCVINGHPNLISTDGTVLLIPNASAPKYFYGQYGYDSVNTEQSNYKLQMQNSNGNRTNIPVLTLAKAKTPPALADYRLYHTCLQIGGNFYRDNLDEIINTNRYNTKKIANSNSYQFAFPFVQSNSSILDSDNAYPAYYSGNLKDLYFNISHFQDILNNDSNINSYKNLIEKVLSDISAAAGNFWDLRLVSATGSPNIDASEQATMKIVDYNFSSPANRGTTFSFQYFNPEALLQSMGFKPTISDAVAIRTIFANTNNPNNGISLTNGTNNSFNYQYKDRLKMDDDNNTTSTFQNNVSTSNFRDTLQSLQQILPSDGSFQITTQIANGNILIRRLVLPSADILRLLLDDGDMDNNPSNMGIVVGIQTTFTIQGIGGLRTFMIFLVENLPKPYDSNNIVFQIINLEESINNGEWTTTITAGIRPIRGQFKKIINSVQ